MKLLLRRRLARLGRGVLLARAHELVRILDVGVEGGGELAVRVHEALQVGALQVGDLDEPVVRVHVDLQVVALRANLLPEPLDGALERRVAGLQLANPRPELDRGSDGGRRLLLLLLERRLPLAEAALRREKRGDLPGEAVEPRAKADAGGALLLALRAQLALDVLQPLLNLRHVCRLLRQQHRLLLLRHPLLLQLRLVLLQLRLLLLLRRLKRGKLLDERDQLRVDPLAVRLLLGELLLHQLVPRRQRLDRLRLARREEAAPALLLRRLLDALGAALQLP